ncbi:MAG: hypothetical protein VYE18_08510 [Pseudomonadota bacterium]|nr:hypothetical protein [Pseudomonadota bacterium]
MSHLSRILAPCGTCAFVTGVGDRTPLAVPLRRLLVGGRIIRGNNEGSSNPHFLVSGPQDFLMDVSLPTDWLSTKYSFEDVAKAFQNYHRSDTVMPLVITGLSKENSHDRSISRRGQRRRRLARTGTC